MTKINDRNRLSCPLCDSGDLKVLYTRTHDYLKHEMQELGVGVRRRRLCNACGNRWNTLEFQVELLEYVLRRKRKMNLQIKQLQRAA